ncbi:MAG: patatin-like phospholipase family protein [Treponema sp.]|jgi:NTE family protein|nr:patatin-like phospholipase family protein [Treponema sp.]
MKINRNLKYALVLSGGGARSLVHVGILSAMEKAGYPPPSLVAGTSMGAIVGGLYASGMKSAELRRFILEELDIASFMESSVFKLQGPLGRIFQAGQALGSVTSKLGIDSGAKVLSLLEEFSGGKKIEDCAIPFLCNAVDLNSGKELVFRSGSLARAIRASMSFPLVFEPHIEGDLCLVDGGVADNMPVRAAREAGAALGIRRFLAVDTRRWRRVSPEHFRNGINVIMRCFDVLVRRMELRSEGAEKFKRADLILRAVDNSGIVDFSRKRELLALGEAAVRASGAELDAFFGSGIRAALARRKKMDCGIVLDIPYEDSGKYGAEVPIE